MTWSFEVATWGRLPRRVATSAPPESARPALAVRVTCARLALAVRVTGRLCEQQRPRPGHYALTVRATWFLGVSSVHPTQFCDSALFRVTVWTLFMSTVHRVKKKNFTEYKIFEHFLVYDLIYEIFILHLL